MCLFLFLLFLCCAELAGATRHANQLPGYDVIVGRGLFVELEGMDERVLYDYNEIIRRQNAVETALPFEALKLPPYYDVTLTRFRRVSRGWS